mgnify:CR=1 FL=1
MHFKLIIAFVDDRKTKAVMEAAREAGATGITVVEHLARHILERICDAGEFDTDSGAGIAIQIDVEDAVGVSHQVSELKAVVEEEI